LKHFFKFILYDFTTFDYKILYFIRLTQVTHLKFRIMRKNAPTLLVTFNKGFDNLTMTCEKNRVLKKTSFEVDNEREGWSGKFLTTPKFFQSTLLLSLFSCDCVCIQDYINVILCKPISLSLFIHIWMFHARCTHTIILLNCI